MRFARPFNEAEQKEYRQLLTCHTLRERERKRMTAIYLSAFHRVKVEELADICQVSTTIVYNWLNHFENGGFSALLDGEMAHRTSPLEAVEATQLDKWVEENPQQLSLVVEKLESELGIETSKASLKNHLKKRVFLEKMPQKSQKEKR